MDIKELMHDSWQTAENHGWHSLLKSFAEDIALFHSEISEALEEYRAGHMPAEIYYVDGKPEGIPIELADLLIRVADVSATWNIPLEEALRIKGEYNRGRSYLHGGKKL